MFITLPFILMLISKQLSQKQDDGACGSRVFMVSWTKKYICDDRSTKGEEFIDRNWILCFSVLEESCAKLVKFREPEQVDFL